MARLTQSQIDVVQGVIDYLDGNYEKPLDHAVADRLAPLHADFGFPKEIDFREGLRDAPFSTLMKSLLEQAVPIVWTNEERALLRAIIEYLSNGYEKPLDSKAVEMLLRLARHYSFFGVKFMEDMRDKPFTVLLTMIKLTALTGPQ